MVLILVFGVMLCFAALVSGRAQRTVLSTAVLFLVAGFVAGRGGAGLVHLTPRDPLLFAFAEVALFTILFVDGAQLDLRKLAAAWRLPGRALLIGMPLTIVALGLFAHLVFDLDWVQSLLVGAILAPTDPVFAAAILEQEAVPLRVRRLLQVESGLNDGLALPLVIVLLAVAGHRELHVARAGAEAAGGLALGAVVAALAIWLQRRPFFRASDRYRALVGVGVAVTVFASARLLGANELLGAFAAGVILATLDRDMTEDLRRFGDPLTELSKVAALLVFGSVLTIDLLDLGWRGALFTFLALIAARPAALVAALWGGGLDRREWFAVAWFGPRGFASILYGLLLLSAGVPRAELLFRIVALVTVVSIVAHSSTDVLLARIFRRARPSAPERETGA